MLLPNLKGLPVSSIQGSAPTISQKGMMNMCGIGVRVSHFLYVCSSTF